MTSLAAWTNFILEMFLVMGIVFASLSRIMRFILFPEVWILLKYRKELGRSHRDLSYSWSWVTELLREVRVNMYSVRVYGVSCDTVAFS